MSEIETTVAGAGRAEGPAREVTRQYDRYAVPAVDIYEEQDRLVVLADLPGVTKDGLTVQVEQGVLTIEGRVAPQDPRDALRREFTLVPFFRQFRITETIDSARIRASLKNGVLRLDLFKAEEAKPRRIPVGG